jgi:nitroimidazol reductase NimA-like FMN-containing flavoprotein (pyridoxamine 5'-phosphate oxidase superfamily)
MTEPRIERPDMSQYGVDTPDWHGLPWSWAAERLAANKNYWVVTVSASGRPHSLPVWGVWDDAAHRFMFSCAPASRKAANIGQNPQVVVTIDDTVHCVSVEGRATSIDDDARRGAWVDRYLDKYRPYSEALSREFVASSRMYEVEPDRAFGIVEEEDAFATRATRWVFGD